MSEVRVRQVECGLNLTVALSADGRLWQMGATGAPADVRTPWERTLTPAQARSLILCAQRLSSLCSSARSILCVCGALGA